MIFHVYANRSNVGDWLSARGIQALLAPSPVKELLCDEPFVPATLAALAKAGADDVIVVGGGGLFMDYFNPFWTGLLDLRPKARLVVWGAGACDLKAKATLPPAWLRHEVARLAALCIVRDELTREHLGGGALPAPVVCPAVAAMPSRPPEARRVLHVDHYGCVGEVAYEAMEAAGRCFAARTGRAFAATNHRIAPDESALNRILDLYRASDIILTSRLHGCILGLAAGRKVLAVSGDFKVEAFMTAAGLGDWVLDPTDLRALDARLEALERQPSVDSLMDEGRRANRLIADQVLAMASGGVPGAGASLPTA